MFTLGPDNKASWLIPPDVTDDQIKSVEIYIAVCKPLPLSFCNGSVASAICQRVTLQNGTTYDFEMGSYKSEDPFQTLKESKQLGSSLYSVRD